MAAESPRPQMAGGPCFQVATGKGLERVRACIEIWTDPDEDTASDEHGTLGEGMHAGLPGHGFVLTEDRSAALVRRVPVVVAQPEGPPRRGPQPAPRLVAGPSCRSWCYGCWTGAVGVTARRPVRVACCVDLDRVPGLVDAIKVEREAEDVALVVEGSAAPLGEVSAQYLVGWAVDVGRDHVAVGVGTMVTELEG